MGSGALCNGLLEQDGPKDQRELPLSLLRYTSRSIICVVCDGSSLDRYIRISLLRSQPIKVYAFKCSLWYATRTKPWSLDLESSRILIWPLTSFMTLVIKFLYSSSISLSVKWRKWPLCLPFNELSIARYHTVCNYNLLYSSLQAQELGIIIIFWQARKTRFKKIVATCPRSQSWEVLEQMLGLTSGSTASSWVALPVQLSQDHGDEWRGSFSTFLFKYSWRSTLLPPSQQDL